MRKDKKATADYHKKWYYLHRERRVAQILAYKNRVHEKVKDYKRGKGCKYCSENNPVCLDFHHISGGKDFNIGEFVRRGKGFASIMIEAEKCEVVCSNCHRKIHAKQI